MTQQGISRRHLLKSAGVAVGGALLPLSLRAQSPLDVVVIGAGLSGLHAASLLEQAGLSVQVLEGSSRIGGRLYTLDDVPGRPEGGGNIIGPTYARFHYLAKKMGVKLLPIRPSPSSEPNRQALFINGERMAPADWAQSKHNPFPEPMKAMQPAQLLPRLLGKNPMQSQDDWLSKALQSYDVPVSQILAAQGLSEAAIALLDVNNSYGRTLAETSALNLHRVYANLALGRTMPGGIASVEGGNQRFPEALARTLKQPVALNQVVAKIAQSKSGVEIICANGEGYHARRVIIAIPFSALRHIELSPALPELQAQAVQELSYAQVHQVHVAVEKPFWQGSGFMPNLWTNSAVERVFANDPEGNGNITSLTLWINGSGAERFDALSDADANALVLKELERMMPESKGALRVAKRVSWQNSRLAGGAWADWRPGQIQRFANDMSVPAGRLHFAGEHTARAMTGMEGALESAERAALEVLESS